MEMWYFVVMKGPFDALLPWRFKQKVTFTIINQAGKKHVTYTFCPDPQSNSFQRPAQKEMNVASGCPMFIHKEQLMKDDCIFLRVIVPLVHVLIMRIFSDFKVPIPVSWQAASLELNSLFHPFVHILVVTMHLESVA